MLPSSHRLRSDMRIKRVLESGQFFGGPDIQLKKEENQRPGHRIRFAILVSKKKLRKAVDRNRARRRIRPLLKKYLEQLTDQYDCVLILQPGVLIKPVKDLSQQLDSLFYKAKLYV